MLCSSCQIPPILFTSLLIYCVISVPLLFYRHAAFTRTLDGTACQRRVRQLQDTIQQLTLQLEAAHLRDEPAPTAAPASATATARPLRSPYERTLSREDCETNQRLLWAMRPPPPLSFALPHPLLREPANGTLAEVRLWPEHLAGPASPPDKHKQYLMERVVRGLLLRDTRNEEWLQLLVPQVTKTSPRFLIVVSGQRDFVSATIAMHGVWEMRRTQLLHQLLTSAAARMGSADRVLVVDVGANVGWFTLCMASWGHRVIAFEPMRENYHLLSRSLELNPTFNVTLYPYGLSDSYQLCHIYSDRKNANDGHTVCHRDQDRDSTWVWRGSALLVPLDDFVAQEVFLLKLDIEGLEPAALKGAMQLLTRHRVHYIFTEFAPHLMRQKGMDPLGYLRTLDELGYTLTDANNHTVPASQFARFMDSLNHTITDLVAFKLWATQDRAAPWASSLGPLIGPSVTLVVMLFALAGVMTLNAAARSNVNS